MIDLKIKIIKYIKKLNSTNLSPLLSGNISIRTRKNGINGFLITPSGRKYNNLKPQDIVLLEPDIGGLLLLHMPWVVV